MARSQGGERLRRRQRHAHVAAPLPLAQRHGRERQGRGRSFSAPGSRGRGNAGCRRWPGRHRAWGASTSPTEARHVMRVAGQVAGQVAAQVAARPTPCPKRGPRCRSSSATAPAGSAWWCTRRDCRPWCCGRNQPEPGRVARFRHHEADGLPRFYLVSAAEPRTPTPHWRVQGKPYAPRIEEGDELRFDLRANPVVTTRGDDGRARRHDMVMQERKRLLAERGLAANESDGARRRNRRRFAAGRGLRAAPWEERRPALLDRGFQWPAARARPGRAEPGAVRRRRPRQGLRLRAAAGARTRVSS